MANLKPVNWKEIAKRGCFVYAYLCQYTFTPYYIGISSRARRPFEDHSCKLPAHDDLIVLLKMGLTRKDACLWESRFISRYGRRDIGTGCLLNKTGGGDGGSAMAPEVLSAKAKKSARTHVANKAAEIGLTVHQYNSLGEKGKTRAYRLHTEGILPASVYITLDQSLKWRLAKLVSWGCTGQELLRRLFEETSDDLQKRRQNQAEKRQRLAADRAGVPYEEWILKTKSEKISITKRLAAA